MRTIREIGIEINRNFHYYSTDPYVRAMIEEDYEDINSPADHTIPVLRDSAREVVVRFLDNASTWRGETARRIKKELNALLKGV